VEIWIKQQAESNDASAAPGRTSASESLNNDDVLRLVGAKLPDAVIVSKIKTSRCDFDTSTNAVIQLKTAGVGDSVIQEMIECRKAK